MTSGKKLVSGCRIVSVDPVIGTIDGDILIDGDVIVAVGEVAETDAVGAEVIDATRMVAMPGFVDAHRHTWQSALRHRNADRHGAEYFEEVLFGIAPRYSADDVYVGTLLGALGAIDAGTTTLFDWAHIQNSPAHADAGIRALKESGLRAVFGHGHPQSDPVAWNVASSLPHPDDIRRIQKEHFDAPGLVTLAMSARGPEQTDDATWRLDLELARELGLRTSMHVGVGDRGPEHRAVERMHRAGALGDDMIFLHLNTCSDRELAHIAAAGAQVSIGIQVEIVNQGVGPIPTDRLLAAGLRPSLSGDSETMGSGDMFTQVRLAMSEYRVKAGAGRNAPGSPPTLSTADVLHMGTQAGADALGLGAVTGSLTPGKQADIVLIDATAPNLAPVSDPVGAIVLAAHPGNVDTVLVAGNVLKRHGELVGVDWAEILESAYESQARVTVHRS
ncbi:amidohydrolase family protein [Sphaerimonospora sp. CA-214678]|uniref:amidohydrolase family protein n=1 Tax=Sphaerimonospora sp. CA-214678 TaxID=3240029 RepID=UPI003D8DC044